MTSEVLTCSFESVNLFPTVLLLITILYWFAVILGALDVGFLDFDLDADFESDVELEVDFSSEVDANLSPGFLQTFLSFFNLGKVPAMVFFSALSISFWLVTININYVFGPSGFFLLPTYFVALLSSMFLAKVLTLPMIPIFKSLNVEVTSKHDLAGALGRNVLLLDVDKLGQAKVVKDEETYTIKIKSANNKVIEKNEQIIVIDYKETEGYFLVEPFNF
jgi:hypothetical protein